MRHLLITSLVVLLGASTLSAADKLNPGFVGTWKLNVAKSKADPGPMPKGQTVTIAANGDTFTTTVDTENADGTKAHSVRTAALDGKDVSVQGGTNANTKERYTRLSDRAFKRDVVVDGKVTNSLRATLSVDGKSFTTNTTGTNAQGQKLHNQGVMDKQ